MKTTKHLLYSAIVCGLLAATIPSQAQQLVLLCGTNKTVECGTPWSFDPPVVVNACCTNPTVSFLGSSVLFSNPCQTVWEAHWQASDCCSNFSEICTQLVTVVDTDPPQLFCSDLTNNCTQPGGARVNFNVLAIDNCDPAPTVTYNLPSGTVFQSGTTMVTATATDACGNSNSCSFTVSVLGNCPTNCVDIFCPPTNVVAYACGTNGAFVPFVVQATNYCDPTNLVVVYQPEPNTWFGLGDTPVDCWVYGSGYDDHCSFTVTVISNCPPECLSLTCSTDIVRTCTGISGTVVTWTTEASNLCNPGYVTNWCVPPPGTAFPIGTNTVTCYAMDTLSGEIITCGFNVVITVPPPTLAVDLDPSNPNVRPRLHWTEVGRPFRPVWTTDLGRGWPPYVAPQTYSKQPNSDFLTVRGSVPPIFGEQSVPDKLLFRLTSNLATSSDFQNSSLGQHSNLTQDLWPPNHAKLPAVVVFTPNDQNPLVVTNDFGANALLVDGAGFTMFMPSNRPTLLDPYSGSLNVHQVQLAFWLEPDAAVQVAGYDTTGNLVAFIGYTNLSDSMRDEVVTISSHGWPFDKVVIAPRPGATGSVVPPEHHWWKVTPDPVPRQPRDPLDVRPHGDFYGCNYLSEYFSPAHTRVPNPWRTPHWILTAKNADGSLAMDTHLEVTYYGVGYFVGHSAEISFTNSTCCVGTHLLLDHATSGVDLAAYDASDHLLSESSVDATDGNPALVDIPPSGAPTCRIVITARDGPISILAICCTTWENWINPF